MLLAADLLEMEPDATIKEELFLLMHRIADIDESECGLRGGFDSYGAVS